MKGEIHMFITETEKRGDYTITTYYRVKDYLKEKGLKKTVKAVVKREK